MSGDDLESGLANGPCQVGARFRTPDAAIVPPERDDLCQRRRCDNYAADGLPVRRVG